MESWVYLLIAILIIVFLVILFFVSFYLNKKTPVPKGCEHLKISDENCSLCENKGCALNKNKEEENKKE